MDEELTFLSYKQPINSEFTVNEILTEDLWSVSPINDNLYKAIPLFNADVITSSNPNDIVLEDNKCLILHADDETIIKAISDDTGSIHYYSLQLYAFTPYSKLDLLDEVTVSVIVFDEFLNTLNNTTINVLINGDVTAQIQTSNNGIAKYTVTEACEVSFMFDENLSNTIMISGGE